MDLLDPQHWQLLGAGKLRTEALNVIPELIVAQAEGECLAAQRVLTEEFWLPLVTRQYVTKENC